MSYSGDLGIDFDDDDLIGWQEIEEDTIKEIEQMKIKSLVSALMLYEDFDAVCKSLHITEVNDDILNIVKSYPSTKIQSKLCPPPAAIDEKIKIKPTVDKVRFEKILPIEPHRVDSSLLKENITEYAESVNKLSCLGKRGRWYSEVLDESFLMDKNKALASKVQIVEDWCSILNNYSESHDAYYREWNFNSLLAKREMKPILSKRQISSYIIPPPVPVQLHHPACWGLNWRVQNEKYNPLINHPACMSQKIIDPPAKQTSISKYAGEADSDDINEELQKSLNELASIELLNYHYIHKVEKYVMMRQKLSNIRKKRKLLHDLIDRSHNANRSLFIDRASYPIPSTSVPISSYDSSARTAIVAKAVNARKRRFIGSCYDHQISQSDHLIGLQCRDLIEVWDTNQWVVGVVTRLKYDQTILSHVKIQSLHGTVYDARWIAIDDSTIARIGTNIQISPSMLEFMKNFVVNHFSNNVPTLTSNTDRRWYEKIRNELAIQFKPKPTEDIDSSKITNNPLSPMKMDCKFDGKKSPQSSSKSSLFNGKSISPNKSLLTQSKRKKVSIAISNDHKRVHVIDNIDQQRKFHSLWDSKKNGENNSSSSMDASSINIPTPSQVSNHTINSSNGMYWDSAPIDDDMKSFNTAKSKSLNTNTQSSSSNTSNPIISNKITTSTGKRFIPKLPRSNHISNGNGSTTSHSSKDSESLLFRPFPIPGINKSNSINKIAPTIRNNYGSFGKIRTSNGHNANTPSSLSDQLHHVIPKDEFHDQFKPKEINLAESMMNPNSRSIVTISSSGCVPLYGATNDISYTNRVLAISSESLFHRNQSISPVSESMLYDPRNIARQPTMQGTTMRMNQVYYHDSTYLLSTHPMNQIPISQDPHCVPVMTYMTPSTSSKNGIRFPVYSTPSVINEISSIESNHNQNVSSIPIEDPCGTVSTPMDTTIMTEGSVDRNMTSNNNHHVIVSSIPISHDSNRTVIKAPTFRISGGGKFVPSVSAPAKLIQRYQVDP